jgi:hypothetical protein
MADVVRAAQCSTDIQIDLRKHDQWVLWRGADRLDEKTGEVTSLTKVPYTVHLRKASTTNPQTWGSFEACVEALPVAREEWEAEDPSAYRGGGLGFVFAATDPYTGIDLDHCRDPETGEIKPWARQIIAGLNSYTEVSPSGTGFHIYGQGRLPGKGQKRGPIELYDRERYFTVTGAHLPGTPTTIEERQAVVEWLYIAMPIIAKCLADSGRGARFSQLFAGDTGGYGSPSEADLALCSLAGKVDASAEQIDALMHLSGLYRAKWDERHGAQTYGQMTIAKALGGQEQQLGSPRALSAGDVVCLATVQPVAVDWLWEPYLPLGMTVSLEGDPGTGKSTLTATLAAYVTTGRPFPGEGCPKREPRNVLMLQCEDDLAAICRPRLDAAGADVSRVYVLTVGVVGEDARLRQAMTEYQPALVIIDPIQAYVGPRVDINKANEVRPIMQYWGQLAETGHCTVLVVRHFGKDEDKKAIHRALGSIDFTAALRSVLQVEPGEEKNRYRLKHAKSNTGPYGPDLTYTIVPVFFTLGDGRIAKTSRIEWAEQAPTTQVLLNPEVRETLEALAKLGGMGVPLGSIVSTLGIQDSTVVERLNRAIALNLVTKERRGMYTLTSTLRGD